MEAARRLLLKFIISNRQERTSMGQQGMSIREWTICLISTIMMSWLLMGCQPVGPVPAGAAQTLSPTPIVATIEAATATPQSPAEGATLGADETIEFITTTVEPRLHDSYPSPDGKWKAEVVIYDCTPVDAPNEGGPEENSFEQLVLTNVQEGTQQVVDTQLINCGGLGAFGLEGLEWSEDSRYFYYTDAREGVPDGAGEWTRPVWRLEAATMAIEPSEAEAPQSSS
jgi:hypothetical protein